MNNIVICYYESFSGSFSHESAGFIPLWEKSWQKNGWDTIILEKEFAQDHPKYNQWDIDNLDNPLYKNWPNKEYIRSVYNRTFAYCNFAEKNGLVLGADYDVINYSFKPESCVSLPNNVVLGSGTCVTQLDRNGSRSIIDNLSSKEIINKKERIDPMLLIIKAPAFTFRGGVFPNDIITQYEECKTSDFVHFHGGFRSRLSKEYKLNCSSRLEFAKKWRSI